MIQDGEILDGMYQIIREIGRGGTGIIYLAYHLRLQKRVVVKKIDPVYFGVIFLAILTTGLITPPVGTLIFTACGMTKKTFSEVSKELIPYTIVTFAVILIAVFVPQIITFLPNLLYQ